MKTNLPSPILVLAIALTLGALLLARAAAEPDTAAKAVSSPASETGPAPGSIAHFRFDGDARDENRGNPTFKLMNTEFRDNALYLNGIYDYDIGKGGYRAICPARKLDYHKFTVALRFKAETFEGKQSTLFMGGLKKRWFGMARTKAGSLVIMMNNSNFHRIIDEAPLEAGAWTVLACGVDVDTRKVTVFLNGKKVAGFDLPEDFKLDAAELDPRGMDKVWTFTDYSMGGTFHGLIDECIIYGEMLSDEAMAAIPLAP